MFRAIADTLFGTKPDETALPLHGGTLKLILKERRGRRYVVLRTSYPGDLYYHTLDLSDLAPLIETLTAFRDRA
ncbi:MAG: hypothetical protein VW644_05130 [Alphaproteobacteria bacterium]